MKSSFRPVPSRADFPEIEKKVISFWKENNIFEKSLKKREKSKEFVFYDGPPFATGLPHYGHLLASILKDIIPRYWTMKGYYVKRVFGWDTHGLPVEYEMERELNLHSKKEIENYGVGKFNEACRSIVLRYTKDWEKVIERIGRWVDFENGYRTMDKSFMETIWWVFAEIYKKGLIYEGFKIMPYCPRCATPLSNFEVNLGYRDTEDPSITVKFKLKDERNTFFLVWTTTPWTLPSNLALAVGENIDYVKVKDGEEFYILSEARLSAYYKEESDYEIVERFKGIDLVGKLYEPIFLYVKEPEENAFKVYTGDFVSTEEGTGIVHIAPAFGEDDFKLGERFKIGIFNPVDDEGKFTEEVSDFANMYVKDADKDIIKELKNRGILVHRAQIKHSYPFCYRCDTPLIYKAISSWFVKVSDIKEKMIDNNEHIHWVPEHIKNGRFGKWLEGARDWAISRNRYWGTPLPVWKCSKCGHIDVVESVEVLKGKSGVEIDDLHKHFVDAITYKCEKCDGEMKRVSEVMDCWFESGSMPYAQFHYPFENKEHFQDKFPADFIAEGLDQTRGWFYTLLVVSTILFDKEAFKNVIVNGLILAEDGKKMSKRLKNYPDPSYILNTYGADALRMYLINSPVVKAEDLKFSEEGLKEILKSVLIPFWNVYSFFIMYANIDKWSPEFIKKSENPLDRWILSLLNELLKVIEQEMAKYHLFRVVPNIVDFIDNLTNWYIRRSRRRFWKSENDIDKQSAYATLYTVLVNFIKIIAPILPFISEEIYQNIVRDKIDSFEESVHLEDFPEPHKDWGEDVKLVEDMDKIIGIVIAGRRLRNQFKIKIRQPLAKMIVLSHHQRELKAIKRYEYMVKDELNIKEIVYDTRLSSYVDINIRPNFPHLTKRFKKNMKNVINVINKISESQLNEMADGKKIFIDNEPITYDDLLIEYKAKADALKLATYKGLAVLIDTNITQELKDEGFIRELVHRLQIARKEKGFEVSDRIKLKIFGDFKINDIIDTYRQYIIDELLVKHFSLENGKEHIKFDDKELSFSMEKEKV